MTDYRRLQGEHGDLVDCLIYMCRNIRTMRNPAPEDLSKHGDDIWQRPDLEKKGMWGKLLPSWAKKV